MKITASSDVSQVDEKELPRYVDMWMQDAEQVINGNLTFSDNMSVTFATQSFLLINTDYVVKHGLGRTPRGFVVILRDQPFHVYSVGFVMDDQTITLQIDNTAGTAVMMFF